MHNLRDYPVCYAADGEGEQDLATHFSLHRLYPVAFILVPKDKKPYKGKATELTSSDSSEKGTELCIGN